MCWIVRKILEDWVDDYILCGDSVIALCWASTEKKSLSLYHRNRVVQIRRGTELDKMFHVRTDQNLADLGTRPEKVKVSDVGPDSQWECGLSWMRGEVSEAVAMEIIKPISELRISKETDGEFKEGLVYGTDSLQLVCNAANYSRIEKLKSRIRFSNYLVNPVKYNFRKLVRVIALVITFINKCRRNKGVTSLRWSEGYEVRFSTFSSYSDSVMSSSEVEPTKSSQTSLKNSVSLPVISDESLHQALVYLYRKATCEVTHFNSSTKVEKIAVLKDGILLSRSRIIDGMNFQQTGGMSVSGLGDLGLKGFTPVIDRYSPLAYCIGRHIHWNLACHRGIETCYRFSLEHVHIVQGVNLFKELAEECIRCKLKRKKFVEMPMGLISEHQLSIAPPFWATQMDLFGPVPTYVPGYEKNTRNRRLHADCYVLVFACPVSRLVNLQVVEKRDGSAIIDGISRLSCEVGIPKVILMDKDSAFLMAVSEVEYSYVDAQLKLQRELGIEFITCPVSGHNVHGQVERRIRSIQQSLEEAGLKTKKLHATGLQTLLKLTENQLNNMPLGYSFGKDQDNTSLLRMISPNMLRVGRNNSRALSGPMRLPRGGELLDKVQEIYDIWFKLWSTSYIPKIMFQPKWWNQERDLKEEDIVVFKKKDSVLEQEWTLGKIDQLVSGRDGLARRAVVKYRNADENCWRTTDRSVRSLVKLWSLDDQNLEEDIALLEQQLRSSEVGSSLLGKVNSGSSLHSYSSSSGLTCQSCCCLSHCVISCCSLGYVQDGDADYPSFSYRGNNTCFSSSLIDDDRCLDEDEGVDEENLSLDQDVGFLNLLTSLQLNLH